MIFEPKDIEDLRKNKNRRIVRAKDIAFNRKAIEKKMVDFLVFPSKENKKNSLKISDSGINSIALKEATKKDITYTIDLDLLRTKNKKDFAEEIGKIRRDLKICKKCKTKIGYIGSKEKKGAQSVLISLGISNNEALRAISF